MLAQMASVGGQSGGAKRKPRNEEANLALGNDRPASVEPPPGLDALGPVWAGNALVQSQANVENQPSPPVEEHHDDYGHGGGEGYGYYGYHGDGRGEYGPPGRE
jgi:hypothetical protein